MNKKRNLDDSGSPFVRITTFGPCFIECLAWDSEQKWPPHYIPLPADKLCGRGAVPARSLLKLLLCQPNRYALRDWIMEQFWPEAERRAASSRLDNVASMARSLLCPPMAPSHDQLRTQLLAYVHGDRSSGSGYQLAPYPLIWVDADAFVWYVEQAARLARFGDDPLPFWERAYELGSRGSFLADEAYSEWATERRQQLSGHFRQCVYELARLLIARGLTIEAEVRLRTYVIGHPTDEDLLGLLMELLGEQQRYQELFDLYQTCEQELAREHCQPNPRTQDLNEYFKVKQMTGERTTTRAIQMQSSTASGGRGSLLPSSRTGLSMLQKGFEISLARAKTTDISLSPSTIPASEDPLDVVKSRRQILDEGLSTACRVLVLFPYTAGPHDSREHPSTAATKEAHLDHSVLDDLECITTSYWRLCANTSLDLLESVMGHFQAVIHLLKRANPPEVAQRLCRLAGEMAQILGKTLFDLHEYALAWSYYTFSLKAAQAACNHDLWAVGLGRMSLLLIYWQQPHDALPLLQEAQQLTIESNRIACWLAAVEAEVQAQLGDIHACEKALQAARRLAASEPPGEDHYATGMNPSRLAGYEGACFVRLRRPERALPALQQAVTLLDPQAVRRQSTLLTDIGIAYAQQGHIEEACTFAKQALAITTHTRSLSVLERVRLVRRELEPWKEAEDVKDLEKHLDMTFASITV